MNGRNKLGDILQAAISRIEYSDLGFTIQSVPGVKVTTSGVTSLGDGESKTSCTHGSNSQRFRSYEVWKKLERKEEHFAFIDYYFLLLLLLISYRFFVQHSS